MLPAGGFVGTTFARSRIMRAVRSRGNRSTELALRMVLVRAGITGWQVQAAGLPGKPDFVFPTQRAVIFTHGCFWHRHGCRRGSRPMSHASFWATKFRRNVARDRHNRRTLQSAGWRVLTIWECEIRRHDIRQRVVSFLRSRPLATRDRLVGWQDGSAGRRATRKTQSGTI